METAILIILGMVLFIGVKSIKIVKQSHVYIIERLGQYHKTAGAGLTIILPFIDRVASDVTLKKQIMDIKPQEVITLDNVTISMDTVVFYQITDPAKSVYEIESLTLGIENLAVSAMRDIIGKMELDETFSSREQINSKLRMILDEATDPWGCRIEKVEIKQIKVPIDIQESMEKQMNAERNKRAMLLNAEAKRQSDITVAEGKKQAAILEAEANKEVSIKIAEGKAEAIAKIAEAESKKIELTYKAIMNANPNDELVKLKALEALKDISNGEANKIFIPFEATNILSSFGSVSEMFSKNKNTKEFKEEKENKLEKKVENNLENNKKPEITIDDIFKK